MKRADAISAQEPRSDTPAASPLALWLAFAAPPAAWVVQLIAGFALATHPCFHQGRAALSIGGIASAPAAMGVQIACFLVAVFGTVLAWRLFRATQAHPQEPDKSTHATLDAGEGRTHFMALCGLIGGALFIASIVFDAPGLYTVPLCLG